MIEAIDGALLSKSETESTCYLLLNAFYGILRKIFISTIFFEKNENLGNVIMANVTTLLETVRPELVRSTSFFPFTQSK